MEKINEKKKILLVDDDEIQLEIAENMLMSEYEIITAGSGKEALNYLHGGFIPNLILLDLLMPVMDGWETYNKIKEISFSRDIPIVFLTSQQERNTMKNAHGIGAADYILKPYVREDLLSRIEIIIKKSTF